MCLCVVFWDISIWVPAIIRRLALWKISSDKKQNQRRITVASTFTSFHFFLLLPTCLNSGAPGPLQADATKHANWKYCKANNNMYTAIHDDTSHRSDTNCVSPPGKKSSCAFWTCYVLLQSLFPSLHSCAVSFGTTGREQCPSSSNIYQQAH